MANQVGSAGRWMLVLVTATVLGTGLPGCAAPPEPGGARGVTALEGELIVLEELASTGATGTVYELKILPDKRIRLFFGEAPDVQSGDRLQLEGETRADGFHVRRWARLARDPRMASAALTGQPVRKSATGAALLLDFGVPDSSATVEDLRAKLFDDPTSTANAFAKGSYNQLHLQGDVFGPYTIPDPGSCDRAAIMTAARQAATAAGIDLTPYDHFLYFYPFRNDCGFTAIAELATSPAAPQQNSWYNGHSLPMSCIARHELLHNFGGRHAQAASCGSSPIAARATCDKPVEYGNPYDVMGSGCEDFGAVTKGAQGWFGGCNAVAVSSDGTFDLVPIEQDSDGVQAISVPIDSSLCPVNAPCFYYLEYRQPLGVDGVSAHSRAYGGVTIDVATRVDYLGIAAPAQPMLLDMAPTNGFAGDPLGSFQLYTDPQGIKISVLTRDATRAKVRVTFPGGGSGAPTCIDGSLYPVPPPTTPPSCRDGSRNGDETGLDCGGSCGPCENGQGCGSAADCWSHECVQGLCTAPTCSDGRQNGNETGVDCGGIDCLACVGASCQRHTDCQTGFCLNGLTCQPSCPDGVREGLETDADCGSGDGICPRCADHKKCTFGFSCASASCGMDTSLATPVVACLAPTCADNVRNGGESGVDCGGTTSCARCSDGQGCLTGSDCKGGACVANTCRTPSCTDGIKNGHEIDVDCGDRDLLCPRCADHQHCAHAADCQTGVCLAEVVAGVARLDCLPASCTDGVRNGSETGIDCGGPSGCPSCATDQTCSAHSDCRTGVCSGGICRNPSCADDVRNGHETDVDCGDRELSCPRCGNHQQCMANSSCQSGKCGVDPGFGGRACLPPACDDGVKNGGETGIDCGGATACARCATGQPCTTSSDCQGHICTAGLCQSASCADGVKNGHETDIDCGDRDFACPRCADHLRCTTGTSCQSGNCGVDVVDGVPRFACIPASCADGLRNGGESSIDCGGPTGCPRCAGGASCVDPADCQSGTCAANVCQ